jgi:hypothetical protein
VLGIEDCRTLRLLRTNVTPLAGIGRTEVGLRRAFTDLPTTSLDHQSGSFLDDDALFDRLTAMTDDLQASVDGMTELAVTDLRHDLRETLDGMDDLAAGRAFDPTRSSLPPSVIALAQGVTVQGVVQQRVPPTAPAHSRSGVAAVIASVRRRLGL